MKNLKLIFLILFVGSSFVKGQNFSPNSAEYKALKKQLMSGEIMNNSHEKNTINNNYDINNYGESPALNWAGQFGGSGNDNGESVITDANNNIYVAGNFYDQMSFNGTDYFSTGNKEAFIAKFDNTGLLVWLTQIPTTEGNITSLNNINISASGNIFAIGTYTGEVTLGANTLPNTTSNSLFYVKLNNDGDILNGSAHNQSGTEAGLYIDTDDSENVYITASIYGSTDSRHPSWILKYDTNANLIWEKEFDEGFNSIIIYNSNIYYTGVITSDNDGYLDDNVTLTLSSVYNDVFIAKSDLDGVFEWGITPTHTNFGDSYEAYFETDNSGNFYMAGSYRGDITFGGFSINNGGGFITKFDESGTFQWLNHYGVEGNTPKLSVDDSGNSYVFEKYDISKYDTGGTEIYTSTLDNYTTCHTISSENKIIISGNNNGLFYLTQLDNVATQEWNNQFDGNSGIAYYTSTLFDNTGAVYAFGSVTNTVDYFGEEIERGSFISKQNQSGDVLWLTLLPELTVYTGMGNQMIIDTISNFLYITGKFSENLIINDDVTLVPAENGSVFIIKYDLDGNYIWSVQEDFTPESLSLSVDNSENIILSGTFENTILIGETELVSEGALDAFVAKYDINGNSTWAISAGGPDVEDVSLVSTDANNNLYFTGEFTSETINFNGTNLTLNEGDGNIIFVKLAPDGTMLWSKLFAQSSIEYGDWYCWPTGIVTDAQGNSYIKGWHGASTFFDDIELTSPYTFNYFIAKIDTDGNAIWANSISEENYGFDYNQFDIDREGNIYIGAQSNGLLIFGDDFEYQCTDPGDLFVAKYLNNGELSWVKTMEGADTGQNWINSVSEYLGNVLVGGSFNTYLNIEGQELNTTATHGFISLFGENNTIGIKDVYNINSMFEVSPNPSNGMFSITFNEKTKVNLNIVNINGQVVYSENFNSEKHQLDLTNLSKGIYFINITSNKFIKSKKIIIQ